VARPLIRWRNYEVGTASLRFVLQGLVRCCLYYEGFDELKPGAAGRIVPTLRKQREEWGAQFIFCADNLKAGPPAYCTTNVSFAVRVRLTAPEVKVSVTLKL
jgi:hypothetical protein